MLEQKEKEFCQKEDKNAREYGSSNENKNCSTTVTKSRVNPIIGMEVEGIHVDVQSCARGLNVMYQNPEADVQD